MKSQKKSDNLEIDIADYCAIKIGSIWSGLKKESVAFWCLCIYIIFEYVRPQSIYPEIDILPWALIFLIFTFISAFLDQSVKWVANPQNPLLVSLFIITLISSIFAFNPSIAWDKFYIVINWVLVYFLIITIVNTEKRLIVFILLFLLVSFKMSQHGFRTFAMRGFSFTDWGVSGSPGWFQNSGEFGIQMTIFVPLATAFILALKEYWGRYKKIFFYLFPLTGLVSIVATSSRGAQLAIVTVGLWVVLCSRVGIKGIVGILIVAWALYIFLPPEQMERFQAMGGDETSVQRLAYWSFGLDTMQDHPGLGIGYNNWSDYCWYVNPGGLGEKQACEKAHNTFIEAGAELGIIALLVFLSMVLLIFYQNMNTRKISRLTGNKLTLYLAFGLDGGLVGFLISGIFISAFFYPFFWVQLAMTVALYEVSKKEYMKINMKNPNLDSL